MILTPTPTTAKLWTMVPLPRCRIFIQRIGVLVIFVTAILLGIHYTDVFHHYVVAPNAIVAHRALNATPAKPKPPPKHLLTLFTSWVTTKDKISVHNNTLRLWATWLPHIVPVLFTNEAVLKSRAIKLGWKVLPITHVTCGKVPVLKTMFLQSQKHFDSVLYGFANSDILFDHTLKENLEKLISSEGLIKEKPCLVTGRRWNVNFRKNLYVRSERNLNDLIRKGSLSRVWGEDYFITNKKFPWSAVPNMVIGRVAVDNYMVMVARQQKLRLIDATRTLIAVHQTTSDGDMAGSQRPNAKCNINMINKMKPNQHFRQGYVDCIDLETRRDYRNSISVIKRTIPGVCDR